MLKKLKVKKIAKISFGYSLNKFLCFFLLAFNQLIGNRRCNIQR